jgi:8-oxo-dGTP diphosphatase
MSTLPERGDVPVFGHPPVGAVATVRPSAYGLAADVMGRIAVVRTPQGLFLAGGGIEPGEAPHDAVVREMREECGLDVRVGSWSARAVDFVYSTTEHTHFEKRSTFLDVSVSAAGAAGSEADHELVWVTPQEAITQLSHPSHRWAVTQWRGGPPAVS